MTHIPVMLEQAVDVLVHRLDGFYVDCTFGRGGHSAAILRPKQAWVKMLGCRLFMDPLRN